MFLNLVHTNCTILSNVSSLTIFYSHAGILYKLHFQVAETCQLAVQRIEWLRAKSSKENNQLRLVLHVHIGYRLCMLSWITCEEQVLLVMLCPFVWVTLKQGAFHFHFQINKFFLIIYEYFSFSSNPYKSVDPAPPSLTLDTNTLQNTLLDESCELFDRYRYMTVY